MPRSLVFTAVLFVACGVSHADTINVFNLAGATPSGVLSGTVTLDATTGKFTDSAIKVLYTGSTLFGGGFVNGTTYAFSGAGTNTATGTGYSSNDFLGMGAVSLYDFDLTLPTSSLIGYVGGSICSTTQMCASQVSSIELLSSGVDYSKVSSGTLTLASTTAPTVPVAVTPEPSALILLSTGVLATGVIMRKRFAK